MKVLCSGGIVLNNYNQIIIVKNRSNTYSFPKGHIEKNENPLKSAIREIYEESGIYELELITYLGNYKRVKAKSGGVKFIKKIFMFLFRTNQLQLNPLDSHIKEAKWVNIQEIEKVLTYKKDINFFRNIHLNNLFTNIK